MNRVLVRSLATLVLLGAAMTMLRAQGVDQCFACHRALEDGPSELYLRDVHFKKGISCAACHGGNPKAEDMEVGMDPQAGFIGVPVGDAISAACAKCHGDAEMMSGYGSSLPTNQAEFLRRSVHGKLSVSGNEAMLQCTTCHQAHGISPAKERRSPVHPLNLPKTCGTCHSSPSFMRAYNPSLPVDQVEKYRTSVHGIRNARGDVKVAECASCHGSHDILPATDVRSAVYPVNLPQTCARCHSDADYMKGYRIRTDQFEHFSGSVHGIALLEKRDLGAPACNDCHGNHGAAPPGVESISKVCGTCHALNADLFGRSPHKRAFDRLRVPECETCHGNHKIVAATHELLGVTGDATCARCHAPGDGTRGFEVAAMMRSMVDSLDTLEGEAIALISEAEQKGMEVSDPAFRLREVRQSRLESRTMVHSFEAEQFRTIVERGISVAEGVAEEARLAIEEYSFRRWGLGVATLIITGLAISLYVLIRRIERRQKR
ncbi:MAG: cytochrome c3 family protein, partial [Bacteroidota bacterium]